MTVLVLTLGAIASVGTSNASAHDRATRYFTAAPMCGAAAPGHMRCFGLRAVPAKASTPGAKALGPDPSYATGPAGGYTPNDLAKAYGFNANAALGRSQLVAIVDAFDNPNALADLNVFDAQYGYPAETSTSFRKVSQTGSADALPPPDAGWAGEISLDIDAVRGVCHTCSILLVEADSADDTDIAAAVDEAVALGATVVSNSYGEPETGPIPPAELAAYDHPGVVVTASTGDHGMDGWDAINSGGVSDGAPYFPASLNTVVAVGGTTLTLNDDATRADESVWNENGPSDLIGSFLGTGFGASGGGCSTQVRARGWQAQVASYAETTCGPLRAAGDVAAMADPFAGFDIYDSYQQSGWIMTGGTSLSSPVIAAMWALAGGSGGVDYPAMSLYGHLNSDTTASLFDVTEGANGFCGGDNPSDCESNWGRSPNRLGGGFVDCAWKPNSERLAAGTRACVAAPGYDGPSGVGVPHGLTAFKALKPTARVVAPGGVVHGRAATFSASTSTDPFPGGRIVRYAWSWGDGTKTSVTSPATTHVFATAGTYAYSVRVSDNYGRIGQVSGSVTVT